MIIVALLLQNHGLRSLLDSSRDLQLILAKSFVNRFYLILHLCVQIFDVMFLGVNFMVLNKVALNICYLTTHNLWCYNSMHYQKPRRTNGQKKTNQAPMGYI